MLAEAEDLNQPLFCRPVSAAREAVWRPVSIEGIALGLSALKPAEDGKDLILRTYEPAGARATARISLEPDWTVADEVNLLEESRGPAGFAFTPFQIHSWRLVKASRS